MIRINPAGMAALQQRLSLVALHGAEAAAVRLREKLSGEGTGIHHAGLPRRSSAPGEYTAEQSGDLMRAAKAQADPRPGYARFGIINGPAYVKELHMRPPDAGGRPFMTDALYDHDIQKAAADAMRGKL